VLPDLLLALDHDRQRRRLHPADGGEEKAPSRELNAVIARVPLMPTSQSGLGAAARGVGQRQHLLVAAQMLEALADRRRRHALQPQALDRVLRLGVLLDQAKDQLALAARVAGVDELGHVLALDEPDDGVEPALGLLERREVEVRRNHRQVGEAPLAALDVELLGRLDLEQVADGRGDEVALALEMLVVLFELARSRRERADDVLRDGRLLGNDQ
jgi:hypothetical protein